jgi:hypothetical protein
VEKTVVGDVCRRRGSHEREQNEHPNCHDGYLRS